MITPAAIPQPTACDVCGKANAPFGYAPPLLPSGTRRQRCGAHRMTDQEVAEMWVHVRGEAGDSGTMDSVGGAGLFG